MVLILNPGNVDSFPGARVTFTILENGSPLNISSGGALGQAVFVGRGDWGQSSDT